MGPNWSGSCSALLKNTHRPSCLLMKLMPLGLKGRRCFPCVVSCRGENHVAPLRQWMVAGRSLCGLRIVLLSHCWMWLCRCFQLCSPQYGWLWIWSLVTQWPFLEPLLWARHHLDPGDLVPLRSSGRGTPHLRQSKWYSSGHESCYRESDEPVTWLLRIGHTGWDKNVEVFYWNSF